MRPLETENQNELPNYPLPVGPPQSSLLFKGSIFSDPAPVALAQSPLSSLSPLTLHDDLQSESLVPVDNDHLVSSGVIASVVDELADRQGIPLVVRGFGATLTISDGSIEVEDHLATALSDLSKKAANDRLSLTLLVEFKGNVSSAGRITQDIITHMKEHIECLAVYVPKDSHSNAGSARVELSQLLLSPTKTSILQHLVWKGDNISDLFLQWGSASNIPFRTLRTLNLTCGLSLEDCIQILSQCENLIEFSAQSLGVFASSMKHDFHSSVMAQLESLTIKSTIPLDKLFKTLTMPQLNRIDLQPSPNTSFPMHVNNFGIPWGRLQSIKIVGILQKSALKQLKEQCNNATRLHLETLDGITLKKVVA